MTPLTTLISEQRTLLGLTMQALAARLGYANRNKGIRRLQSLMEGDLAGSHEILSRLAAALQVSPETVVDAVQATEALKEAAYRAAFVPHAVILTERTVPSQITFCAVTRGGTGLRIVLNTASSRGSYARQALAITNQRTDGQRLDIPFFGSALGFVVNYDPCRAVRFDLDGRALQLLPRAAHTGPAQWTVG